MPLCQKLPGSTIWVRKFGLRGSSVHSVTQLRRMGTAAGLPPRPSHAERTAAERRGDSLHRVVLSHIDQVNNHIRVLRLTIPDGCPPIKFLPGQWLDVHIPGVPSPGGFTITSTPLDARPSTRLTQPSPAGAGHNSGYLELAVRDSPQNSPAAWLWRPAPEIINQELDVRVGGGFVWPPPSVDLEEVKRVVFVAGGVGINPLMSIVGYLAQLSHLPYTLSFLYSVSDPGDRCALSSILFLERLAGLFAAQAVSGELLLHLTPGKKTPESAKDGIVDVVGFKVRCRRRRITKDDLLSALGHVNERQFTLVYICGVPAMTDEFVDLVRCAPGMDPGKLLFERWW